MKLSLDQWEGRLGTLISASLAEFAGMTEDEMELFAVDCHPWNGVIVLGFLTHSELRETPFLSKVSEMAAWKYYDFGACLESWQQASDLASVMRSAYDSADEDRPNVARQFFQRCALAVASEPVQKALSKFRLVNGFKISVQHPDTSEEYYLPN